MQFKSLLSDATLPILLHNHAVVKSFFLLLAIASNPTDRVLAAPTDGNTVVFAFSTSTGRHGWHAHPDGAVATQVALRNCNAPDARAVCNAKNGYLALVWGDDGTYAWGASVDLADEAYTNAVRSFSKLHPIATITGQKVVSSDGFAIPVR